MKQEVFDKLAKLYPQGPGFALVTITLKDKAGIALLPEEQTFLDWVKEGARSDLHKHRCLRCMGIWEHDGAQLQMGSDKDYQQAHLCPRGCGIDVRDRYFEEEVKH